MTSYRTYALWSVAVVVLSGLGPYLLALSTAGVFLVPFLLLACSYSFVLLFDRLESEQPDERRRQRVGLLLFAVLVGFWLVFSTFFRTPLSSVVAYAGVGVQLYFAWRRVRHEAAPPMTISSANVARVDLRRIL